MSGRRSTGDIVAGNPPRSAPAFGFGTPFAEQLDFFRAKLNLPSERWDDIVRAAHDRAFIVAGAGEADLLQDLHGAIDKATAEGRGLEVFRKDFAAIVQKNGWTGWTGEGSKAGVAWRTKVIYQTNMATSYAAGRYKQLTDPEFLQLRPYWRYVHADGVMYPRPLHLAWGEMRLTLRYDHPFWATHFPPNGWGCHCYVVAEAAPGDGAATEPPMGWDAIDPKTGAQVGIDKGFDYAPGANASTPLADLIGQKLINLDADIGAAMAQALKPTLQAELSDAYGAWLDAVLADPVKRGRVQVVGALAPEVLDWLAVKSIRPVSAEIAVDDAVVVGRKAQRHLAQGDALTPAEWVALPEMLDAPGQVLYDTRSGHLIFVAATQDPRLAKIAVEFDYLQKREKGLVNMIVSAYKTQTADIEGAVKGGQYEVVN